MRARQTVPVQPKHYLDIKPFREFLLTQLEGEYRGRYRELAKAAGLSDRALGRILKRGKSIELGTVDRALCRMNRHISDLYPELYPRKNVRQKDG